MVQSLLKKIYFDPKHPAGFSSVNKLFNATKKHGFTLQQVKNFLASEDSYTLHRPRRIKYPTA